MNMKERIKVKLSIFTWKLIKLSLDKSVLFNHNLLLLKKFWHHNNELVSKWNLYQENNEYEKMDKS